MKHPISFSLTAPLTASLVLLSALATTAYGKAHQRPQDLPACAAIARACEAAGFEPGDHSKTGKGLWVDCIGQIAKGKTIAGVTATKEEARACRDGAEDLREAHREKRDEKNQGKQSP